MDIDCSQLLAQGAPQECHRLAVDEVRHAHGQPGEDEGDVLPLPDEVLNSMGHRLHLSKLGILHLVNGHQEAGRGLACFADEVTQTGLVLYKRELPRGKRQVEADLCP